MQILQVQTNLLDHKGKHEIFAFLQAHLTYNATRDIYGDEKAL
jgi:hypothetical protein